MNAISASHGMLVSTSGLSLNRLAAMSGNAAFLAPLMAISPLSRAPPLMRMRSITPRGKRQECSSNARRARLTAQNGRKLSVFRGGIGAGSGWGCSVPRIGRLRAACDRFPPGQCPGAGFAALEVLPEGARPDALSGPRIVRHGTFPWSPPLGYRTGPGAISPFTTGRMPSVAGVA
jgi:hypothetical protein